MNTMNRCLPLISKFLCWLTLAATLALFSTMTQAQGVVRPFPANALRGLMQVTTPPLILLNGQPARLAPGARIKNTNNLIVLSASLVGQQLLVNYVTDPQGLLHEVWILTPAEAQQKRPGLDNISNIRFGSDVDGAATAIESAR